MKLLSKSLASAEIKDAVFSDSTIEFAANRSDVEIKGDHTYVASIPQIFHGETTKRGGSSNRILVFDVDNATGVVTPMMMPHSILTSIFVAPANDWNMKTDRLATETRYLNDDKKKPYLRPDCQYMPATQDGNINFDGDEAKKTLGFHEPFALRCVGVINTINARYDRNAPKLHGSVTPLSTFDEDGKTYAKLQGRSTPIFQKVSSEELQQLLANVPSTKEEFKQALEANGEGDFYAKISKYFL